MEQDETLEKGKRLTEKVRQAMLWMPAFTLLFFIGLVILFVSGIFIQDGNLNAFVLKHAQAIIGIPISVIVALGIVVSFEISTDKQIKLSTNKFELSGPAIPVILWVVVFMSLIAAIKLLW